MFPLALNKKLIFMFTVFMFLNFNFISQSIQYILLINNYQSVGYLKKKRLAKSGKVRESVVEI